MLNFWPFNRNNTRFTLKSTIIDQMNEKRPLPVGMTEFEEWSDRIISGTLLPADSESQKFALATMLMHLPPTTDHETDGYFIKSLRKGAINQIAHAKMEEIRTATKKRLQAQEEKTAIEKAQALYRETLARQAAQQSDTANQCDPALSAAIQKGAQNSEATQTPSESVDEVQRK